MTRKSQESSALKTVDEILCEIIDEWYRNVSGFYVTQEKVESNPDLKDREELKRFHDESGHRIKFNKGDLDFTYGLKSVWEGDQMLIEVSVNNKVENFDYNDFQHRLISHYEKNSALPIPSPFELNRNTFKEVFELGRDLQEAFTVERRIEKADIMRLSFRVHKQFVETLAANPAASKHLIENYCVSPFRSAYAAVYRSSAR